MVSTETISPGNIRNIGLLTLVQVMTSFCALRDVAAGAYQQVHLCYLRSAGSRLQNRRPDTIKQRIWVESTPK